LAAEPSLAGTEVCNRQLASNSVPAISHSRVSGRAKITRPATSSYNSVVTTVSTAITIHESCK